MLSWTGVERLLRGAPYFWIATTDADGRPHLVQQWGVWIDQRLFFEGSERTRWARNLARDPRVAFGMQSNDNAAYGEGEVDVVRGLPRALARRVATQYGAKYGRGFSYRPKPEQYEKGHVFRLRPEKLIVFDVKRFETSATRFTFNEGPDPRHVVARLDEIDGAFERAQLGLRQAKAAQTVPLDNL
jgi:hypothetical protein